MLRILFLYFLLLPALVTNANIKLSNDAQISVLTCSQGKELYSAFGHSAIRVYDKENNVDLVFNYGTFDFNTPNFYLKFANGKLNYMLSVSKYDRFLASYFRENRSVIEQVLNLSHTDKQAIFTALLINYQPENRYYKYDFFYDNCATRIFDIVNDNLVEELKLSAETEGITFREYLHHYLQYSPWIETGLNTILGLPADKVATLKESTYLPDFLMDVCKNTQVKNKDRIVPLVKYTGQLLEFDLNTQKPVFFFTPVGIFTLLLLIVSIASYVSKKYNSLANILDRTLFFIAGFIGVVIAYLWFVTDHTVTGTNLNILWALPSFLYLAFSKMKTTVSHTILKIHLTILVFFVITWYWIPQSFPIATIPVALLLSFRVFKLLKVRQAAIKS
ncbi:DUF4105 domain-containing protein [Labilibacter sediminis]|nr:DUF4105 domain-containing protein [Labilibacter sediminis]